MQYFFDTSAVVKIYHQEMGSDLRHFPLLQKKTLPLSARTNDSPLW